MPVLITGVEEQLGRTIAERMLATGGEVRVWLDATRSSDEDAVGWRAKGCKAAIGSTDDEGRLEAALEQVHTVVHAAGGPLEDPDEATEAVATLVSATLGAGCRRLVWVTEVALSRVGDLTTAGPYLAALAERAELLERLPMDVVILRTGLRYGPDDALTARLAARSRDLATAVPHAPVWIDDVAAAVVAADAQRGSPLDVHVTVDLVGPDVLPLARVAEGLATVPALTAGRTELPAHVPAWLSVPGVADAEALGRTGRSFTEGLRLMSRGARTEGDGDG